MSESVIERISEKAEEIGPVDFMKKIGKNEYDLLGLVSVAANGSDEVKNELSGWDRVFQFKAHGAKNCYLKISGGRMSACLGDAQNPDVTLETSSPEGMMAMLTGAIDGTTMFMSGKLRIDGQLSDAIKFGNIGQLLQKILTNDKIIEIWKLDPEDLAKKLGIQS
ncbi:MAG: SCP2 sterol-binding domain-containing protein [Promethearchaeati archaeon SRVP18_Atabeyarchaeia-1]